MGFFNRRVWGRTLLLAAAIMAVLMGCGGEDNTVSNETQQPATYTLQISINPIGGGTVSRNPDKSAYSAGERVTVSAAPASGYRFVSWSGVSTSTYVEVIVAMDADLVLTANLQQMPSDGSYETVSLGGKMWMKKNLNIVTEDSWCYENSSDSCAKYGRLYRWAAAKSACKSVGMRLPSRDEWGALAKAAGGTGDYGTDGTAGKALKADHGWYNNGNGTDDFGFSALPGGHRYSVGDFYYAGNYGLWWTATEDGDYGAYYRNMKYDGDYVNEGYNYGNKGYGFSVRCVQE